MIMMDAPLSMARDGVVVKHEPEVTVKLEHDPIPAPLGFEVAIKPEPEPNNGALRHIAPPMGLRPEDAPKLAAVVKLEMAKVKADNPYVERVLLHRQLDIAKVCGGGGYCTFPHAELAHRLRDRGPLRDNDARLERRSTECRGPAYRSRP